MLRSWRFSGRRTAVFYTDARLNPATSRELPAHLHPPGVARSDQIIKDEVGHVLVKTSSVAIVQQVILEALKLDAQLSGTVDNDDCAKVRQACFRADTCELRTGNGDEVVALWKLILKGLERIIRLFVLAHG